MTTTTMDLANMYAKYYVADLTKSVMQHLQGSHPIPSADLDRLIEQQMEATDFTQLTIGNSSTVSRFVFECAEFALEHNLDNVDSKATWAHVAALPSIHHTELNAIVFASADLYRNTMDKMVIGTIARDADTAAKRIGQLAQARATSAESGGSVKMFNWGILNDGQWLNNALTQASERAAIFKDDQAPIAGWVTQAFNAAHHQANTKPLDPDQRVAAQADLNLLLGDADQTVVNNLLEHVSQESLNDLLFGPGVLSQKISDWDTARNSPKTLIQSIEVMSATARLLDVIKDSASRQSEETMVSDYVRSRIHQANQAVTLALVGYEALRETRFADTLIMSVAGQGTDPKVDVFVNADQMAGYQRAHGTDENLIRFSFHLDPRTGMPESSSGWTLQYVMDRQDNVIPQAMAMESDRIETMRRNDASVIRAGASTLIRETVESYLTARQVDEVPLSMHQAIGSLSQDLVGNTKTMRLDERLTTLFAQATGDAFVEKATTLFVNHLNDSSGLDQYASAATIAKLAFDDGVGFVTSDQFL